MVCRNKKVPAISLRAWKCMPGLSQISRHVECFWLQWNDYWLKKFNLEGSDGFEYYWYDLRKEQQYLSTRQQGRKAVVIWDAISNYGVSDLLYKKGLSNILQHFRGKTVIVIGENAGNEFILQLKIFATPRRNHAKELSAGNEVFKITFSFKYNGLNNIKNITSSL